MTPWRRSSSRSGRWRTGCRACGRDLAPVRTLLDLLEGQLLPHERADEALLVPVVARALDGTDATAAMSRTHAEIEYQVSQLHRLLAGLGNETVQPEDVIELRRLLYGLYAVLRLHNAQEEEDAFSLVPNGTAIGQADTGLQPPASRPLARDRTAT